MILTGLLVIGALAFASYELWRRRAPTREVDSDYAGDPPPPVLSEKSDDAGDGGGDA